MASSAYIHIPFCAHKCDFCDFAAFAGVDELSQDYCEIVVKEIKERLSLKPNSDKLHTLFYGGGTPGYIEPALLETVHRAVADHVGFHKNAEITLETTPRTITPEKAASWLEIGINRISVGIESLNDSELKAMGRDHCREECIKGVLAAREGGYSNLALDLMYGLPEQTVESWTETLDTALELAPDHISAYGLTIAVNSPLLQRYPRDSASYPDEDQFVSMYEILVERCTKQGLEQYEIANFARPGYESRHNLTYWHNRPYLGFGVSAHRYVDGVRSSNFRGLKKYMRDYLLDETSEEIDLSIRVKEGIMLGLRLRKGIDLAEFKNLYGVDLLADNKEKISSLSADGFLELVDGCLKLSQRGVLVSNSVIGELI